MFESFYGSFIQHPLLLWAVPIAFLFFIPRRLDFFALYLWCFTALTILDALFTGPGAEWLGLSAGVREGVAVFFVILGDARFFVVIEHFSGTREHPPRPGTLKPFATALLWSLVVPVAQLLLIKAFPQLFSESRYTFLVYELLFFALAVVFRFRIIKRRQQSPTMTRWLDRVCGFAMTYYALWAGADILILWGDALIGGLSDWGFGLRVVPNVLYYGVFLPFVFWHAPLEYKRGGKGPSTNPLPA